MNGTLKDGTKCDSMEPLNLDGLHLPCQLRFSSLRVRTQLEIVVPGHRGCSFSSKSKF